MLETILSWRTDRAARRRHDHDDRQVLLDQRDRPVLELARGEALGVHVRELLELQRALQGHRVAHVPAEEQHACLVGERPGQRPYGLHGLQDPLDLVGDLRQVAGPRRGSRRPTWCRAPAPRYSATR